MENNNFKELIIYTTPKEKIKVELFLHNETLWLTQERIAELFGVQRPAISKHLKNIFESGELSESLVSSILEHTTKHGAVKEKFQVKTVKYYNLDAIISIGYRVNSSRATAFRIWATERIKEYIVKGFTMDDERLKNPEYSFGKDFFEEQLERIREIRSSERRFYQKITDIYSQCSADYDKDSQTTRDFFATVQNKLHWAITGQTTAQIIASRADSNKENIGLTSWKNSPFGKIRKSDVSIAKNFLNHNEIDALNRIVTMYLDYAENMAKKRNIMYMSDWVDKLDAFLKFNEYNILSHACTISHELALSVAEKEFDIYNQRQEKNYFSDFDGIINKVE